ncbi:glycosyl hydrolases family 31-domain-containing protein [Lasiosphaeria hispida]|uniref:alpha-glucosidase n=1 Tax=Lasiosphaeria hispida TaxID=260671 RepID=A0AAJ0HCV0_9PEZI|nr:glycosyl hydrolases family 31-domain-containing protein [Lasiosphaeria hispida]
MAFLSFLAALLALCITSSAARRAPATDVRCPGYEATNVAQGDSYLLADLVFAGNCSLYNQDITNLRLLVEYQSDSRLHVLIGDADDNVYQVQEQVLPRPHTQNVTASSAALEFSYTKSPFSFQVKRASTGETLFDSSSEPLIFESQFVQIQTSLPQDANLYGLGEHSDSFRLPASNYERSIWNAESPFIPRGRNLYGSHPVYFDHRLSGTHGVFLASASGMDINFGINAAGERYLQYTTIGGVLDFYFLAGPDPTSVSKQYAEVVGLPAMMPYWILGFHQCKYGWDDIGHVKQVVANYSAAGIPLETLWGDIDYMDEREDFTTSPDRYPHDQVRALVDSLHENNQHYIVILDPGIHRQEGYATYDRGAEKDVFLKNADGSPHLGRQWAGQVVWPDWFAPSVQDWWTNEIKLFFDASTGIDVDGLWVDMDEASNMCDIHCMGQADAAATHRARRNLLSRYGSSQAQGPMKGLGGRDLLNPPYRINNHNGDLSGGTLATNIANADGSYQYDTHNLYGHMMAGATHDALLAHKPTKRPFVLTRSTFAGSGRKAAHWFGDNASTWDDYRVAIAQMLAFTAIHAMPMVGSDICGFNGDAQEHMCARWATLGAFQPFYRNHADISAPSQEFYRWDLVKDAAKKAIDARYRLLDYVYTAMHAASTTGAPIASPLWFAYPQDANTFGIQTQWLWGDALVVSPVVNDDSQSVTFYLPNDVFYDFWTWEKVASQGAQITVDNVAWTDIPVHIRGGSIIPLRVESASTTAEVRAQNFTVVVAPGVYGAAKGALYLDDGESLDVGNAKSEISFSWDGQAFQASGTFGFATDLVVESVTVLGQDGGPQTKKGPWGLEQGFSFHF